MDAATFLRESFRATIAFSVLVLLGLLLAALWFGDPAAAEAALLAMACAYVSQTLGTFGVRYQQLQRPAIAFQLLSALFWVAGFLFLSTWRI